MLDVPSPTNPKCKKPDCRLCQQSRSSESKRFLLLVKELRSLRLGGLMRVIFWLQSRASLRSLIDSGPFAASELSDASRGSSLPFDSQTHPRSRRSRSLATSVSFAAAPSAYSPRHISYGFTLSEARSRLYQKRFWPPNNHFAAFFKIYKICTILRSANHKILETFVKKSVILK